MGCFRRFFRGRRCILGPGWGEKLIIKNREREKEERKEKKRKRNLQREVCKLTNRTALCSAEKKSLSFSVGMIVRKEKEEEEDKEKKEKKKKKKKKKK